MEFKSSLAFQVNKQSDDGNPVYFMLDTMELFGVDLHFPGLKKCFNTAYRETKNPNCIPVDSGLTMRSYTIQELDDHSVILYFNPNKIVGKMRKGKRDKKAREVKEYYVQYISSNASRLTWLDVLIHEFLKILKREVTALAKETPSDWRSNPNAVNLIDTNNVEFLNLQTFTEYVENEEMRYQIRRKRRSEELMTREEMKKEIQRQKESEKKRLLEIKKLKELKEELLNGNN